MRIPFVFRIATLLQTPLTSVMYVHSTLHPFLVKCKQFLVIGCFLSMPIFAEDKTHLMERLQAIHSLSAQFHQVVYYKTRVSSQTQGIMAFERPLRFRFEIKKPVHELLLADGKQVWIYSPELEQVIVKPQAQALQGTPALFLTTTHDLIQKDYNIIEASIGHFLLKAKHQHLTFPKIQFDFQGKQLKSIVLEDTFHKRTVIQLIQVKQNLTLPKAWFIFKIPRGVDVIYE